MIRDGVYRVTVEHASTGALVDELCFSFPDPEQAGRAHDMAAKLLTGRTPTQLVDLLAAFNTQTTPARTARGCGPAMNRPPCEEAA